MTGPRSPIERARLSLAGLSVGDAFGETFFTANAQATVPLRHVRPGPWHVTDDTIMAIAIVQNLADFGRIDQDSLAADFARRFSLEPDRGYGATSRRLLRAIHDGADWREASAYLFDGMGSMGNGGAMRAGPIGAFFAPDYDAVVENARRSAEVTHANVEGQTGAIAVAVAAAYATTISAAGDVNTRSIREERDFRAARLFELCISLTPPSLTRAGIIRAAGLDLDYAVSTAATTLGSGWKLLSQDTVPFCLWCIARTFCNYEDAIWTTVSGLGDMDTTCAIVGSVVALVTGEWAIPLDWRRSREPLPV